MKPKYKRVLIKLSGEALSGEDKFGISYERLEKVINQIKIIREMNVEVGIVIGGGNFWRGRNAPAKMDRTTADHMGMLATIINALALQDALESIDIPTRVQTAISITRVAEPYILRKALRHLEKGRVVIFACGTGNPYFSTDTGAALRATEIHADVLLLAKNVDGVYDDDPNKNSEAKKLDKLSHLEFITKKLSAMDTTAVSLCMENNIPIIAFGLNGENSIVQAVCGKEIGTLIG
ncbi:MAG: UMP kinase [Christensenellales bacterium]|jgi:uridylate kinase